MDVLLLAPVNPFDARDGHRMAVASDLRAILDNNLSLGVITFLYKSQQPTSMNDRKRDSTVKGIKKNDSILELHLIREKI